jgi:hypothetical protein
LRLKPAQNVRKEERGRGIRGAIDTEEDKEGPSSIDSGNQEAQKNQHINIGNQGLEG